MNQNDHIDEHLLLQYLLGKSDSADKREIEEWLNKSDANRRQLDRLEVLWMETGKLVPPPVVVDTAAAWQRLSARIEAQENALETSKGGRIIRMQSIRWVAGIAAAVLVALGFWWLGLFNPQHELLVMASIEEVMTDTLPDGSLVTLNKNSTLLYPEAFEKGEREVTLLGEAFFEVKHDSGKPFIVKAGSAGIRVAGTSFDVRAYPDQEVEVFVSTGTVILFRVDPKTGDSASVILTAGMKGILPVASEEPLIDSQHNPDELFWMNQKLEFRQTPLSEVVSLLMNCYHVQIQLSNEAIESCKLTAFFSGEPIDLILQVIADTFGLTLEQTDGTYRLTGNDCGEADR
ncbi:MAG: FecR domain-containing protein [Bacteroidales bacterium]|nr:FecR domain-containing protein [Bacteroidales bacterium]